MTDPAAQTNSMPDITCVICPDGATVGDDFAPDADRGDPTTCKEQHWCPVLEDKIFYQAP